MTDVSLLAVLLGSILLVSILTLAGTILNLRSSRRSETFDEERNKLLREQWDRLEILREERRMLIEDLERQSREREQLMEFLGKTPSQLVEDLKKERREHLEAQERIEDLKQERLRLEQELHQSKEHLERERRAHLEAQQRAEQLERHEKEQSGIQEELERLGEERQRLTEDLKREREERLRAERRADSQVQERARLEGEFRSLRAELYSQKRAPTRDPFNESETSQPWWRRPVLVIGLVFGALILWLTSLGIGLYLLSP
jgi:DNA repair exonuclease SbcCD ATPase subunit